MADAALIAKLMAAVRVKTEASKEELEDLMYACIADLRIAGVYVSDPEDPLCLQAIKLYVKAHYGYDDHTDKFEACYSALKDAMALCGEYAKEASDV